jgi:hypothetical protein
MALYWLELKKLLSSAAVWGFIGVCLLFDVYLAVSSSGDQYADFVGAASKDTGYLLGQSFHEKLSQLTGGGDQAKYLERLTSDVYDVADVFDGYETKGIAESYIAAAGATGGFAGKIRDKYSALQKVVDEKAAKDESLALYFAGATYSRHQELFNGLMGWLLIEGILISTLLVLLSVGYENSHKTENIVYSTKTGRHILRSKITASISAGLGAYALLALFTFLVYFSVNEYGSVWGSSVSSVFNYRYDVVAGYRPFVTWYSFSVLTYFLAMQGMSAGLILCFSLMAFGIGVLIRNHYIGFLVLLTVNAAIVVIPSQIPKTLAAGFYARYYYSMLSPVWLWLKHSMWFTDGDVDILWPHFETLGLCASFLLLTALCILAAIYFRKRDLI